MQNFSGFLKQKSDKWDNFSSLKSVDINTSEKAKEIKAALTNTIQNKEIPGAVFILAWGGKIIIKEALGYRQIFPNLEEMTSDTIFDLASLTKVVATWPSILVLLQRKSVKINAAISEYLKISRGTPLEEVTIFDLLTHTSGLPERTYLRQYGESREAIISGICSTGLMCPKNKHVIYSNRGYILLGFIIEEISQQTLAKFVTREFWQPLQMNDTFFNPSSSFFPRIAPTEYRDELGMCQRGSVHDENAAWLGGVAGHAGVFSTANDLSNFCASVMAGGTFNGIQVLDNQWIKKSFTNLTIGKDSSRGLSWEMYKDKSLSTPFWGHNGFTGTSIWINPKLDAFAILLTNRVHPNRNNNTSIQSIRNYVREKSWDLVQNQIK